MRMRAGAENLFRWGAELNIFECKIWRLTFFSYILYTILYINMLCYYQVFYWSSCVAWRGTFPAEAVRQCYHMKVLLMCCCLHSVIVNSVYTAVEISFSPLPTRGLGVWFWVYIPEGLQYDINSLPNHSVYGGNSLQHHHTWKIVVLECRSLTKCQYIDFILKVFKF